MGDPAHKITTLLQEYVSGKSGALEELYPEVYKQLHHLAVKYMNREKSGHTLQPTALVNEAFIRLVEGTNVDWQNRAHFFAVCARIMRRLLTDHAKAKKAEKRGGNNIKVSFDEQFHVGPNADTDLLALEEAMVRLEKISERQAQVVELRFFGGLSVEETAEVLATSPATVKRDWATAKMWLYRELQKKND